jgi:2-C-methyl-D-erythritol 4-phosphate cytidylyltransferase
MSSSDGAYAEVPWWVVIPAAGASRRMGAAAAPKQYLPLAGRTVIEWSLAPFLEHTDCRGLVVVLAPDDGWWRDIPAALDRRVTTAVGGEHRVHSVLSGLTALAERAHPEDWVLVHDAARPCLAADDLRRLIERLAGDEAGGLLAAPLIDTLKRADSGDRVLSTVSRDLLWRALTPQMFRFGLLRRALALAIDNNLAATDESQAIEALGFNPRLVPGDADNIKITIPADLERAARILASRKTVGSRL